MQWVELRHYLQEVWHNVAYNGLNSAVTGTISNIAVGMIITITLTGKKKNRKRNKSRSKENSDRSRKKKNSESNKSNRLTLCD